MPCDLPKPIASGLSGSGVQASNAVADLRSRFAPAIVGIAKKVMHKETLNLELLTACWLELRRRRRTKYDHVLNRLLHRAGIAPIRWLDDARKIMSRFSPSTKGHHYLYFVLLGGYGRNAREYGVYVGETARCPEIRLAQHKAGTRASGVVRRRGIQLLVTLAESLNPLGRAEAKRLEPLIAKALTEAGIRTKGGH